MSKEKTQQKENEKNEPIINLLDTFKKNIISQVPFYPLNNLTTQIFYMVGKQSFLHISQSINS